MTRGRITVIIVALGAVAIVAVLTAGGAIDLSADEDSPSGRVAAPDEERERPEPESRKLPENPDDVRGSDPYALTRPDNLRRALAVLDRRRQRVEGVFDGLRIAPGRIDTVIIHPDDRRTNLQIRPDFEIAFESTHDFPTQADFRVGGLSGREVDVTAPARLLRGIDRQRSGSAARDVDYLVIGKSIVDSRIEVTAYMRIRTARPRHFRLEDGRVEAFG